MTATPTNLDAYTTRDAAYVLEALARIVTASPHSDPADRNLHADYLRSIGQHVRTVTGMSQEDFDNAARYGVIDEWVKSLLYILVAPDDVVARYEQV